MTCGSRPSSLPSGGATTRFRPYRSSSKAHVSNTLASRDIEIWLGILEAGLMVPLLLLTRLKETTDSACETNILVAPAEQGENDAHLHRGRARRDVALSLLS